MTNDAEVIFQATSPDASVEAFVEQDDRVAYLYLRSERPWFGLKACWLRNHVPGPAALDSQEWSVGKAPRLPRLACRHPQGAAKLVPEDLDLVWFDTGDGAALYERGELLAVIPPWSGTEGFHGYARDCRDETEICWPLPHETAFLKRLEEDRAWWKRWQEEPIWPLHQRAQLEATEKILGPHLAYFRIDNEHWPPRGAAVFESKDGELITTIGVSLRPQPSHFVVPGEARERTNRIELAFFVSPSDDGTRREQVSQLASLAAYPWFHGRGFGDGHTVSTELPDGRRLTVVLVSHLRFPSPWRDIVLPRVDGQMPLLLIALPLDDADLKAIRSPAAHAWLSARLGTPEEWPV